LKTDINLFAGYLRVEKKYSEHTVLSYVNDLTGLYDYCKTEYTINEITQITHLHIRSWIVEMISHEMSSVSVNRKISALRSFYKWLIRRGMIDHNPMLKITAPKMPKRLPVVVQEINMQKLSEKPIVISENPKTAYAVVRDNFIIVLLYSIGIRRAELVGLKVSDFDFFRKEVRIVGKGNKVRSIPLTDTLTDQLKAYLEVRQYHNVAGLDTLFLADSGKPIYPRLVHDIVRRELSNLTTLSKKSPHVLRHTFATHMLDKGADLNGIKEILGHASLAATQVYTHSSIQKLKDVYNKAHPSAQNKK
jgi:integrase/recombinase XerC